MIEPTARKGLAWPLMLMTMMAGARAATGKKAPAITKGSLKRSGGQANTKNDIAYRYLVKTFKGAPISKVQIEAAIIACGAPCGYKNLQHRYRSTDWDTVRLAAKKPEAKKRKGGKMDAPPCMRLTSRQTAGNNAIALKEQTASDTAFREAVHLYKDERDLKTQGLPGTGKSKKTGAPRYKNVDDFMEERLTTSRGHRASSASITRVAGTTRILQGRGVRPRSLSNSSTPPPARCSSTRWRATR